jgi:hypothetical protein
MYVGKYMYVSVVFLRFVWSGGAPHAPLSASGDVSSTVSTKQQLVSKRRPSRLRNYSSGLKQRTVGPVSWVAGPRNIFFSLILKCRVLYSLQYAYLFLLQKIKQHEKEELRAKSVVTLVGIAGSPTRLCNILGTERPVHCMATELTSQLKHFQDISRHKHFFNLESLHWSLKWPNQGPWDRRAWSAHLGRC